MHALHDIKGTREEALLEIINAHFKNRYKFEIRNGIVWELPLLGEWRSGSSVEYWMGWIQRTGYTIR